MRKWSSLMAALFVCIGLTVPSFAQMIHQPGPKAAGVASLYAVDPIDCVCYAVPQEDWPRILSQLPSMPDDRREIADETVRGGFCMLLENGQKTVYAVLDTQCLRNELPVKATRQERTALLKTCRSYFDSTGTPQLLAELFPEQVTELSFHGRAGDSFTRNVSDGGALLADALYELQTGIQVESGTTERAFYYEAFPQTGPEDNVWEILLQSGKRYRVTRDGETVKVACQSPESPLVWEYRYQRAIPLQGSGPMN